MTAARGAVAVDPRAARAWPAALLGLAAIPAGSVIVGCPGRRAA